MSTKKVWFFVRTHLTKAMGGLALAVGYGLQHQAEWVALLSEQRRGVVLKYWGLAVFLLGVYNWLFPPQPPAPPAS